MARIKLNLRNLSTGEKIAKARQIEASLTGNPDFPHPTPDLATVSAVIKDAADALVAQEAAKQETKTRTSALHAKEDTLEKIMTQVAAYVEAVAGDDERLIRSAGMDVRAQATAASDKPADPSSLNTSAGDTAGEIDLSWDSVANARSYLIQISADPPTSTSWVQTGVATKSKFTAEGLVSGTRYWFRVAAISTGGQSGWSDPSSKIAP